MTEHAHGADPVGALLLFLNLVVVVVVAVMLRLNRPGGSKPAWRLKDEAREDMPDAVAQKDE